MWFKLNFMVKGNINQFLHLKGFKLLHYDAFYINEIEKHSNLLELTVDTFQQKLRKSAQNWGNA